MLLDPTFWTVVAVAIVLWITWRVRRPKWQVKIVADAKGVRSFEGLALRHKPDLVRFFGENVGLKGRVTIRAQRERNGRLRVRYSGRLDRGTQQQIRNFLITVL